MKNVKRIFDIPAYQLEHYPQERALVSKVGEQWVHCSIQELIEKANLISMGLLKMGILPRDKIAMISNNRTEWNIVDIGIMQIGAVNVPVYPTISEEDYKYIFNDAEVKLCIVSDDELLQKVVNIKDAVPSLKEIYTFNSIEGANNWQLVLDMGKDGDMEQVKQLMANVKEDDLATLIYTSGTTGTPKGVMLSHKNLVSNAVDSIERLPVKASGKALSFLPVCHVYERMLHYLYLITGVSIYFAESLETVGENIREVKPNVFTAVPRLLEKIYDKIVAKGNDLSGIKKILFFWALDLGLKYELHGANGWWYELQLKLANKIIFTKWREALGGETEVIASGSAALQPRLSRVFNAAGIAVMEGYGLTETSPVISVNCVKNDGLMFGTVGRPIKNVEIKIAEDGEILIKGPNVMLGYYKRPDLTKEVIDAEGWLHTGDIGEIVSDNFLKITDRKKEMFKTSGGKYIAPQMMENKFKESLFIEQIMVIGEGQKHPSALIVPAFVYLKEWCARHNVKYTTQEDMIKNQTVIKRIGEEVDRLNKSFGKWEQIKKFELLPAEWTIGNGELTPTLKYKRKVIKERYKEIINGIYSE